MASRCSSVLRALHAPRRSLSTTTVRDTVYMFPGQGSQRPGMGADLMRDFPAAREVAQEVDEALGFGLSRVMAEGEAAALQDTRVAQPAILTASIMAWRVARQELSLSPDAVCGVMGHSVGEFSALVATGALALPHAATILAARGAAMATAGAAAGNTSMVAVFPADPAAVLAITRRLSRPGAVVAVSNFNTPSQVVLSGHAPAVQAAVEAVKEGARCRVVPLAVSAPFHCPLMAPAIPAIAAAMGGWGADSLLPDAVLEGGCTDGPTPPAQTLGDLAAEVGAPLPPATPPPSLVRDSPLPLFSNHQGAVLCSGSDLAASLLGQTVAPVHFTASVEAAISAGGSRFLSFGPGSELAGMVRAVAGKGAGVKTVAVGTAEDMREGGV